MTALAGCFGPGARDDAAVPAILATMPTRGDGPLTSCAVDAFRVSLRAFDWERTVGGWHGPQLLETTDLVVAADASLYYMHELRARLRRFADVPDDLPSVQLVALAARTWGMRFARQLEGDYALVVYDKRRRAVMLARDFAGKRTLAWARTSDGGFVFASSPRAVWRHPGVASDLDLDVLAAAASGLMAHGERTAFAGVRMVPAGATVFLDEAGRTSVVDQWEPPPFSDGGDGTTEEKAAATLRDLLERATAERLPQHGVAVTWMSGGMDSTSVFAAGHAALEGARRDEPRLLPVSLSYPQGDRGRENELIEAIGERWRTPVSWVDVDAVPLLGDLERRTVVRDDPMAHAFEAQQRALAVASRAVGARVVLEGYGGDQLFHSSSAILADLVLTGRWLRVADTWRRKADRSPRAFARLCASALLTNSALDWLGSVRGHRVRGFWDGYIAAWMLPRASLNRDARPQLERYPAESVAAFEQRLLLTNPFMARVAGWNQAIGLDEGVQLRSPLYDTRVIEFAATRPLSDRNDRGVTKNLLRRSMRGLLPDSVLAPKARKMGVPADYFSRQFKAAVERWLRPVLAPPSGRLHLGDMGLVDTVQLAKMVDGYAETGNDVLGSQLMATFQVEYWLALSFGTS